MSEADLKFTPPELADACVTTVAPLLPLRAWHALEPSAGKGAFVLALSRFDLTQDNKSEITAIEIDATLSTDFPCDNRDFLQYRTSKRYDLIIGNPPFSRAEEHIRHALHFPVPEDSGRMIVAFILKIDFLASLSRIPFWRDFPPSSIHVLRPRPSFTGDGRTEFAQYMFAIWTKNKDGEWRQKPMVPLTWLDWRNELQRGALGIHDWPNADRRFDRHIEDPDPLYTGPDRLNTKYATCQVCHEHKPSVGFLLPCPLCEAQLCSSTCRSAHHVRPHDLPLEIEEDA